MSPLIHLTRFGYHPSFSYHPGYAYHPSYGYGYHHALGGGWLTHMIVSSVIHAMIYSVIFRLFSHMSLGEAVLLVVVVIAVLYSASRNSPRRW
jgi:hypothetical protein